MGIAPRPRLVRALGITRLLLFLAALLSLAPGTDPVIAGPAADEMGKYDEAAQKEILGIEIRSSGNRCHAVERMMYLGEARSRDIYSAKCVDAGFDYIVMMRFRTQLGGSVRLCVTAYQYYGFRCWRPIATASRQPRTVRVQPRQEPN